MSAHSTLVKIYVLTAARSGTRWCCDHPHAGVCPDALYMACHGPAQQKRKRKREQLEKLQIASYIRQQTARAPVRKWTREWWVSPLLMSYLSISSPQYDLSRAYCACTKTVCAYTVCFWLLVEHASTWAAAYEHQPASHTAPAVPREGLPGWVWAHLNTLVAASHAAAGCRVPVRTIISGGEVKLRRWTTSGYLSVVRLGPLHAPKCHKLPSSMHQLGTAVVRRCTVLDPAYSAAALTAGPACEACVSCIYTHQTRACAWTLTV